MANNITNIKFIRGTRAQWLAYQESAGFKPLQSGEIGIIFEDNSDGKNGVSLIFGDGLSKVGDATLKYINTDELDEAIDKCAKLSDITGVYRYKGIMDPNNIPENPSIGDTYSVGGESWDPILCGPDMTNATLTYYDEVFTLYCPDIFYYISESSGAKLVSLIVKLGDVGYNLKFDENNPGLYLAPSNKNYASFTTGYDNSKISVNKMYYDSDGPHNDAILYSDFVSEFNTFINHATEYTNNLLGDFDGQQSYVIYKLIPEIGDNLTWNGYIWESTTNGSLYYTKNQVDSIVSTYETKTDSANKLQEAKDYTDIELERLKYYGDSSIIPSDESYFTVNSTGETITRLSDTGKTQTELVIPYKIGGKEITSIGAAVFAGNASLTSVVIPNSVTSIGNSAFNMCKSLTSIDIPNSVTSIGNSAFDSCASLTSINIPNSVTSIGNSAFSSCASLTSINIPNSVTSIENDAFSFCRSLTSINIPNSITSIAIQAFSSCTSLASIDIPNSVTSIGTHAFIGCTNLTIYCEQGSYAETYAKTNNIPVVYTDVKDIATKPVIITDSTSTSYTIEFLGSTNKIIRLTAAALSELNLTFHDGEYNPDLIVNVVFNSGDTATHMSYPSTGILNWVGTDCALSNGRSVFIPSANTRYDVVISFDGTNLLGNVCGYTPATLDNKEDTSSGSGATN